MDNEFCEEGLEVPSGILIGITLRVLMDTEKEKLSVMQIGMGSEVTNLRLGLPNPTNECSSCGAKDRKACEGHFGFIKFPFTILHPYFLSNIAKLLNSICPKCKTLRKEKQKLVASRESFVPGNEKIRTNGSTNNCNEVNDIICSRFTRDKRLWKKSTVKEPILQHVKRQKSLAICV